MPGSTTSADLARQLVVGLAGSWPTAEEIGWLAHWQPAGVILFSRNVTGFSQLQELCDLLHQLVPGGEIVADHEGGPVVQLAAAVGRPPVVRLLGELDNLELTRAVHEETGRRLAAVGIDRVLAPCCDVLTEPRNPVIGARAFGTDAEKVARQVAAAVEGLIAGGVATCLKHWPGHGASFQDSHLEAADAPEVDNPGPFLAGLAAGSDAVMVGHLLAPGSDMPATLDRVKMREWRTMFETRANLPVKIYADDVTMGGLRNAMAGHGISVDDGMTEGMVDPADLPVSWLEVLAAAGSDRILIRGIPWRAFPASGTLVPEPRTAGETTSDKESKEWVGKAYEQAICQQQSWLAAGFGSGSLRLGWLDLTRDDRWEVAGGDLSLNRRNFLAHLGDSFAEVVDLVAEDIRDEEPIERLLVTSHRPLADAILEQSPWLDQLSAKGRCLAMGHPSLGPDLKRALGSGWSVTPCYDVDWDFRLTLD